MEYKRDGKIKPGDEVFFVVDPTYKSEDHPERSAASAIFMAVKVGDKFQPVDIIPISTPSTKGLRDKMIQDFENDNTNYTSTTTVQNTPVIVYNVSTHLDSIKNGRLSFKKDEEFNLESYGLDLNNKRWSFGIYGGANMTSMRGKEEEWNLLFKDNDATKIQQRKGRLYLGIKGGNGRYIPVAVRLKRLADIIDNTNSLESKYVREALGSLSAFSREVLNLVGANKKERDSGMIKALSELKNK